MQTFLSFLAQLLYLSKQSHPGIHLSVSLLCTIVIMPDNDYFKKLERVTKYVQGTIGLPLILSIDKSVNIKWYVDASFELHEYMMSRTCGFITMGTVGAYV